MEKIAVFPFSIYNSSDEYILHDSQIRLTGRVQAFPTFVFIVFCVGGSKAPPVLYSSYRTHNVWTGAVTSYSV